MEGFETRNLVTADAGTTVTIRKKGDSGDGFFSHMTILGDSAHTIAFWDGDPALASSTLLFTKPASTLAGTYKVKRAIKRGLFAVVASSFTGNILVAYL